MIEYNLLTVIKKHNIKKVFMYNLFADKNTLKHTFSKRFLTQMYSKCEFIDLMTIAVNHIVKTKEYIETPHNYREDAKRKIVPKYSVQTVYEYITQKPIPIETHNSKNDSILEVEILKYLHDRKVLENENNRYKNPNHIMFSISKYVRENREKQV
jgi:hypothetical protein